MLNIKLIKGITYYPAKLKNKINKTLTIFKCNYFKKKLVNDLSLDIIDKLCITEMGNVIKLLLDVFGFNRVKPYDGCCLKESDRAIVIEKNNKNYLIKFSNNKETVCVNKIAMYSVVASCDYNCVKTILISNHEFCSNTVKFAEDLNLVLIDRFMVKTILNKVKKVNNIKKKQRIITKYVSELI